jgi:hypothetical protein
MVKRASELAEIHSATRASLGTVRAQPQGGWQGPGPGSHAVSLGPVVQSLS